MRFQSNKSSCGPAALHNALAALGIYRSEDELIALCKQKPDGTSARGLINAIKAIASADSPLHGRGVRWRDPEDAVVGLWWTIAEQGRPVVLCVDSFEHWVACTGYLGRRFAVMDSADNRLAIYYTHEELLKRWVGPAGGYHGVVV
jgi:ABC-type bacteriocin/lantibiotic exporter with double-glycine peptidase domain